MSIEDALNFILEKYFNKLSQPIYGSINWAVKSISSFVEAQDTLLRTIEANKKKLTTEAAYSSCRTHLKNHAFNEMYVSNIVAPFTGKELNALFDAIASEFTMLNKVFPEKRSYLLFPIHANYSVISEIWIFDIVGKGLVKYKLLPYSRGIFGLHNLRPHEDCVYVVDSINEVISKSHKYYNHGMPASQCCVSIEYDETANFAPDPLYRGLLTIDNDTEAAKIIKTQTSFQELGLINKNQVFKVGFEQAREARTYLLNKFISDLGKDLIDSEHFSDYLNTLKTDPLVLERIKIHLRHTNKNDILALIESNLNKTEIQNIKGNIISCTRDGYVASGRRGLSDVLFTNFTIDIKNTIMFRDSPDVYYSGNLLIREHAVPYVLSKKEIHKTGSIVHAATASVASSKLIEKNIKPPALLDNTFSTILRNILADQISNSKILLGVGKLGWSDDYEKFQAPGWSVSGSSVETGSGFKHPNIQIFNNFSFKTGSINQETAVFDESSYNIIISLLTSMLGRSYMNMRCSPIRIKNNENNRLLLASILSVFQQKRTIDLNPNLRVSRKEERMIQGVSGYPIVCSCSNPTVINRLYDPIFVLANSGLNFSSEDPCNYSQLTKFSEYYFPKLINELIQTNGAVFDPNYEDRSSEAMIKEGLKTLKMLMPNQKWFITTGKHQVLMNWLCQIPPELLSTAILLDFEKQKIRISLLDLPNFPTVRKTLEEAGIETYKMNTKYVVVGSEPFLNLLSEIFVETPKIGTCKISDRKPESRKVVDEADDVGIG